MHDEQNGEILFFSCGSGDTILLRFPGNYWGLIDCYLPVKDGVRERFFRIISANKIERLEFVLLTHSHYDHYHGMTDVVAHFTSEGRSLGAFVSAWGAIDPRFSVSLLKTVAFQDEFIRLCKMIESLADSDLIDLRFLSSGSMGIAPRNMKGGCELLPVAPDALILQREYAAGLTSVKNTGRPTYDFNATSIVLVLAIRGVEQSSAFLLTADIDSPGLHRSMKRWHESYSDWEVTGFAGLKIPHHGSINSHDPLVCSICGELSQPRIAVISCGSRSNLPHRKVLEDFAVAGWNIYLTTKRHRVSPSSPLSLAAKVRTATADNLAIYDVSTKWSAAGDFTVSEGSTSALVTSDEFDRY